ncbi:MAG TPA: ribosome recycling factor [Candidatus Kapabacteria bacterium]|nr:ribosome recycling factor [Candidatus Kapabacteria bacterium]
MTTKQILLDADERMNKALEVCRHELTKIHAGRATTGLLDGVKVDYYGTLTPINHVGSVSAPDPRLLIIAPWEKAMLQPIEKAILAANLGFTPQSDGTVVRIPIAPPNEERRKELVKLTKKFGEDAKIAVRNVRRDAIEHLKKSEKEEHVSEDERKHAENEAQKLTDAHIKQVDDLLTQKEKEIMEV